VYGRIAGQGWESQDNMPHAAAAAGMRIAFVSACPGCGCQQTQWYSQLALYTRLRRGHPVEGYCVVCQEYWELRGEERDRLAEKLAD
jgi:hypothetical protein